MDNLKLWNEVRRVPDSAMKPIKGGRLKGMTDINPLWRMKILTEQFGTCGIGWKYEIVEKHLEQGANNEIAAFVDINLYIKVDGKWSEPIPGTGGSMLAAKESKGLYTSDEAFKMALTDAISVSCKALGVGADVYWEKDATKYDRRENTPPAKQDTQSPSPAPESSTGGKSDALVCKLCKKAITPAQKTLAEHKVGQAVCPECREGLKEVG